MPRARHSGAISSWTGFRSRLRAAGRHRASVVIAAAVVVAAGSCGGRSPSHSTLPSGPATSPGLSGGADEQALDAYRGMWKAYAKAAQTANPDEPDLARYAKDRALTTLKEGLINLRKDRQVIKGEYVSKPKVAPGTPSANPHLVTIEDCLDDSKFLTYQATGELAGTQPGGRRATRATVTFVAGDDWKVTGIGIQAVGTC